MHKAPAGTCEAAIAWARKRLCADQDAQTVAYLVSFASAKLSQADRDRPAERHNDPVLDMTPIR